MDIAEQSPDGPARSTTILVAEDDAPVRKLVARVLTRLGYAVIEAGSPGEAIRVIGQGTQIDLLLTDVSMPEMSGGDLAAAAMVSLPSLAVIFMSGYGSETVPDFPLAGVSAGFLQKPFTLDELGAAVRLLLDGSGRAAAPTEEKQGRRASIPAG